MTIENKNIDLLYNDLTADLYNIYKKSSYLAIDTEACLLYTSPSPRDQVVSRMPSSA